MKNYPILFFKKSTLFLLFFMCCLTVICQEINAEKEIDSVFKKFTEPYQEVMYAHLNKSKFIVGETIGFTIYAFNKKSKSLSTITTNIYCVITDNNQKNVKELLIKAENGIANGDILIDESFKKGLYTFKVYTNWMLNFSPQNIYVEPFEIISSEPSISIKKVSKNEKIDVQMLPESGHLLNETINTIGVIAKDSLGAGINGIRGEFFNSKDVKITSFTLNHLGIGRFSFTPQKGESYYAVIDYKGEKSSVLFTKNIDEMGVILKLTENKNEVLISAVTNKKTLPLLKNKKYKMAFHDGNLLKSFPVIFEDDMTITKKIELKNLTKGVNVFTLFDENNSPIAERIFFNYNGIQFINSNITQKNKLKDSMNVVVKYDLKNKIDFNNVSISVLPKDTKSYDKSENIVSQILLKPYVNGVIENARYYFTNISKKTIYDLNNLLITQGWSSYDWTKIFQYENNFTHQFEEGIAIKVNIPKVEEKSTFLIHQLSNRNAEIISFNEEIKSFNAYKYYPTDDENLFISKIGRKGKLEKPALYIQFNPTEVPKTTDEIKYNLPKENFYSFENLVNTDNFIKLNKRTVLNEVVITANLAKNREEKIIKNSPNKVYFLTDYERNLTLANFLNIKSGFNAFDDFSTGQLEVYNRSSKDRPAIFIDNFQVFDKNFLFNYWLSMVEYIEINNWGFGASNITGGQGGLIKIVTNPLKFNVERETLSTFDFPITFTKPKKFYIPKYESYQDSFFKNYGVIDWLPINKIDENGVLSITFNSILTDEVILFLEGVTDDGTFIIEEKIIKIE